MEQNRSVNGTSRVNEGDLVKEEYTSDKEEIYKENYCYNYTPCLSSREMESLVALCDTLLPSIDISQDRVANDSLIKFYQTSASMNGTPNQAAMMMI
ncbi:hypothetical protein Tco_0801113 [Tanacetum coccineum]|uniref:Uncharacterized protein n=1 Tax=Tanacetum coccineum TaxID=301880 RepID=A0ABQ4ZW01_9ASTR